MLNTFRCPALSWHQHHPVGLRDARQVTIPLTSLHALQVAAGRAAMSTISVRCQNFCKGTCI